MKRSHTVCSVPNEILFKDISLLLSEGREVVILTKGNSMLPFIAGGRDKVKLRACAKYSEGDVVLACLPGSRYVLHRIFSISGNDVILRGDGNLNSTEVCPYSDILARAVSKIRPDGRESRICDSTLWWHLPHFVRRCLLAFLRRIR